MYGRNNRVVDYGPEGWGGVLSYFHTYIRRLVPFLGVQNFDFQYYLGFQKK